MIQFAKFLILLIKNNFLIFGKHFIKTIIYLKNVFHLKMSKILMFRYSFNALENNFYKLYGK